jgi:RHS repeat-associated protein
LYDEGVRSRCTGKERDGETGNDYFGARYYASYMGRWMVPDWSDDPEPVPFADFDNPQSMNLYGYVANNPTNLTDDDGHTCTQDDDGNVHCDVNEPGPPTQFNGGGGGGGGGHQISYDELLRNIENQVSDAVDSAVNWFTKPRDPGCMAHAAVSGAAMGTAVGAGLGGAAGGAGGFALAGGGSIPGAIGGAAAGGVVGGGVGTLAGSAMGFVACASGGGGGSGSSGGGGGGGSSATARSATAKKDFLKSLAHDPKTPSWMKPWLEEGRVPPGYNVDHRIPLSVGGADSPSNMRLVLESDHVTHHQFYHPWR